MPDRSSYESPRAHLAARGACCRPDLEPIASAFALTLCVYSLWRQLFYDEKEAAKYNSSSRIVKVQQELSYRAIELLNLPEGKEAFILDVAAVAASVEVR